jgi:hypothetical protein
VSKEDGATRVTDHVEAKHHRHKGIFCGLAANDLAPSKLVRPDMSVGHAPPSSVIHPDQLAWTDTSMRHI